MEDPKNKLKMRGRENEYKSDFKKGKYYKAAQTEWYQYYLRELGDVTKLATIAVQSSLVQSVCAVHGFCITYCFTDRC